MQTRAANPVPASEISYLGANLGRRGIHWPPTAAENEPFEATQVARQLPAKLNRCPKAKRTTFAAGFLLPEEGVRQFVASLGKGAASRIHADVFDESGVVAIDSRTDPGTQEIQLYDVVQLAHSYGVRVSSTFYSFCNLELVFEP